MRSKIFITYSINAVISVLYVLSGIGNIITATMRKNTSAEIFGRIKSMEMFSDYSEAVILAEDISDSVLAVLNAVKLYVYGYPSLIIGLIALALSSIGVFLLTEKQTRKSAGYYFTISYSFIFLGFLTFIYLIAGINIF
ncbi:MAG: hypothetical protein NC340_07995 [Ruminococcus flavefaciens]|nr:hypothetical protein [Ruminococcus flavefaciens]MCM1229919.1 hypothetical protein [Ruminococcus flavefaciens]